MRSPRQTARHGALHEVVCFVPAQPEDLRGTADAGLQQHVDREPLEPRREPRRRIRPRHPDLPHAMVVAADPRDAGVEVGLERAAVQVAPRPFLIVIVQPTVLAALGTWPRLHLVVLGPHIHALLLHIELDAVHGPRFLETQELSVQFGVAHAGMIQCRHRPGSTACWATSRLLASLPPRWRLRLSSTAHRYAIATPELPYDVRLRNGTGQIDAPEMGCGLVDPDPLGSGSTGSTAPTAVSGFHVQSQSRERRERSRARRSRLVVDRKLPQHQIRWRIGPRASSVEEPPGTRKRLFS